MKEMVITVLALLTFVTPTRADSYIDSNGTIIFPDGSVITSVIYIASTAANGYEGFTSIDFQFAGGHGFAANEEQLGGGEFGGISFTEPVSNLSVGWADSYGLYMNFTNAGNEVESVLEPLAACCSGVVNVPGSGYFGISWDTDQAGFSVAGPGGITSLDFTVPEPGTSLLLLVGLLSTLAAIKLRVSLARM